MTVKWWQQAVYYQIYPRSFAASNGHSGTGDLAGITSRLDYLATLGINALWICPVFTSPQVDHGYDVSDYRDIDPIFGTLADFDELLAQAHSRGIRVVVDVVPNHTSSEHAWFQAAVAAGRGSPERERYLFRDGRGDRGELPPTDVLSSFGGPAWTRVDDGQWYFHMHDAHQPDLNWTDPAVLTEFESIFKFWLDRGVDGFRIDVADHLTKDVSRTDAVYCKELLEHGIGSNTHTALQALRAVTDGYSDDRTIVGEVGAEGLDLELYVRGNELPMAFNFPFLHAGWDAAESRRTIDAAISLRDRTGALPTWVTESHDERRSPSRYSPDPAIGMKRSRAMAMLLLSLPGAAFIFQGQELGLPNVDDIPDDALQDPQWERSGHTVRGRDGCRVPLPWSGTSQPFGFAPGSCVTWLPQPDWFAQYTVESQLADPNSTLAFWTELLAIRATLPSLRTGELTWIDSPPDVLVFDRRADGAEVIRVVINMSAESVNAGEGRVLARSHAGNYEVSPDSAVWTAGN